MKGCYAFPKAPASLEPHRQIVLHHIQDICWESEGSSAEAQSLYSTAPADWAAAAHEKVRKSQQAFGFHLLLMRRMWFFTVI